VERFHDEGYGFDAFGLHPPAVAAAVRVAAPLYDHYFRVESVGAEHIPQDGATILVANHGGVLPIDAAILGLDVLRQTTRIARLVTDHFVPRLPIASTLLARVGVVSGTRANVKHLLDRGELIAIWPEGVTGPAKPFRERYLIQSWRVGFAELAIRYRAPVIPVAIVGAEESWPMLTKLRARVFGTPYLPLPATPLPLPTKFHLRYGEPIVLHRDHPPSDADDPEIVAAAAARVRFALEDELIISLGMRRGVFR
jgi:1-acyl-sn-glycerol-3-phosphate acyltransferase